MISLIVSSFDHSSFLMFQYNRFPSSSHHSSPHKQPVATAKLLKTDFIESEIFFHYAKAARFGNLNKTLAVKVCAKKNNFRFRFFVGC